MTVSNLVKYTLSAALALLVVGCDGDARQNEEAKKKPAAVNPPTTLPIPQAATQPSANATSQPAVSFLFLKEVPDPRKSQAEIDPALSANDPKDIGVSIQFPRARLRLTGKGESHLVALLYSDDPKEAITKDWKGDRYYFRMPLQAADLRALESFPYRSVVEFNSDDDTSNGVFLKGDRYHFVPIDLSVRFEMQGSQVVAYLGGLFKQYDTTDIQAEPKWFQIQGIVPAVPNSK